MLIATNAIVLSQLKYRDNDLIVKCYTKEKGVMSFLQKGALKAKSKTIAYFQPLSQLHLVVNFKPQRALNYIKDIKLEHPYSSLHSNILKSAIVLFLSEVITNSIKEEEPNPNLYSFLETSFLWLDTNSAFSNFHLLFLLNLTKYLGFYPNTPNKTSSYFNLYSGEFENENTTKHSITGAHLTLLKQLLGTNFAVLNTIKLSSKQRQSFLLVILLYFELHLEDFKSPKSLQVFNDVFS